MRATLRFLCRLLATVLFPILWLLAVACDRNHRLGDNARLVWRGIWID